jgi:hypothetical protein
VSRLGAGNVRELAAHGRIGIRTGDDRPTATAELLDQRPGTTELLTGIADGNAVRSAGTGNTRESVVDIAACSRGCTRARPTATCGTATRTQKYRGEESRCRQGLRTEPRTPQCLRLP